MAVVTVRSAAVVGVEAFPVDCEVALTNSLPGLRTVGLPDAALREGKDRILLALRHQKLTEGRPSVIVNLAPAELPKTGARYELAIALGILGASEYVPMEALKGHLIVGELSLNGAVRGVTGVLTIAVLARDIGMKSIMVPAVNAREASLVDGLIVYPVSNLREAVEGLRGERPFEPFDPSEEETIPPPVAPMPDLADVRGQSQARRAVEIAASGSHNLLFVGPPGSGKTMLARRLPGILPPLTRDEAIETTRVLSTAGLLAADAGLCLTRPFRAPHHTISSAGLIGGYSPPRAGEVSLAHNGVLFLDEMAEFSRRSLESLREPIEEGSVRIRRGGIEATFPARAVLVAATNPCPCGYLGDPVHVCSCGAGAIDRYRGRLSGPLLDRIDLHVDVPRPKLDEIVSTEEGESSASVAKRVARARERQTERFRYLGVHTNSQLDERMVREVVPIGTAEKRLLERAVKKLGLSPRAYVRVLKVARTIADLADEDRVATAHLLEAIQYRSLEGGYR